jgi:hypothetical protein
MNAEPITVETLRRLNTVAYSIFKVLKFGILLYIHTSYRFLKLMAWTEPRNVHRA